MSDTPTTDPANSRSEWGEPAVILPCPCGETLPHYHDGEERIMGRWWWQGPGNDA